MCGLYGIASSFVSQKERNIFSELGIISQLRGYDATGIATIRRENSLIGKKPEEVTYATKVVKDSVHSTIFFGRGDVSDALFKDETLTLSAILGHCRWATIGDKGDPANSHPFDFENLVGMHNGTVHRSFENRSKFGTDSEGMYALINEHGLSEGLEKATDSSDAFALTYFDKKTNQIVITRNFHRPLFYCYDEYKNTIFWASEANFLHTVLARNNVKMHASGTHSFEIGKVYKFNPSSKESLGNMEVEELVIKRPFFQRHETTVFRGNGDRGQTTRKQTSGSKIFRFHKELGEFREYEFYLSGWALPLSVELDVRKKREKLGVKEETQKAESKGEVEEVPSNVVALLPDQRKNVTFEELFTELSEYDENETQRKHSKVIKGFSGRFYSRKKMEEILSKNCCEYCGSMPSIEELEKQENRVHWLSQDKYLCDECMDTDFVKAFVTSSTSLH